MRASTGTEARVEEIGSKRAQFRAAEKSGEILEEYIEVLRRLGLEGEKELDELLALFGKGFNIQFTRKTPVLSVVMDDPDDDKFIECAVALGADYIISGDKALLLVGQYKKIKILPPQEFLKIAK
jgi:predicted nucleic acid-binding protein